MVLHMYNFLCTLSFACDWTDYSNNQNNCCRGHPFGGLDSNEDVVRFTWKLMHFNWNYTLCYSNCQRLCLNLKALEPHQYFLSSYTTGYCLSMPIKTDTLTGKFCYISMQPTIKMQTLSLQMFMKLKLSWATGVQLMYVLWSSQPMTRMHSCTSV